MLMDLHEAAIIERDRIELRASISIVYPSVSSRRDLKHYSTALLYFQISNKILMFINSYFLIPLFIEY